MILDKQLNTLISRNGITIAALSRVTGVNSKTLYQWSNGQRPKDLVQLKKVANHFNISIDALVFGEMTSKDLETVFPEINAGVYEVILRRIKLNQ